MLHYDLNKFFKVVNTYVTLNKLKFLIHLHALNKRGKYTICL